MSTVAPQPPLTQASDTKVPGLATPDSMTTLDSPDISEGRRPPVLKYMSTPAYHSPLRHHKRAASSTRHVKETLNARSEYSNSEDDGTAQHRINQYLIKEEIGRGSFGAVHLAVDQYGQEYAVKEFSKSRLRKRAQSNLLRRPSARRRRQGPLGAGIGFNSPLHRHSSGEENNALDLIKEEIAIMKKLNHPNVVSLIEVLDDPEEDSLYMVMEMCKKGVVMQVGLEERADPYDEEQCRCWFRDMILGIEYLHAQGIIHRDIKPDNCLVTDDDVLKIVDFGVSEMFDKQGEMKTAKSAGSPAFMPPELCVPKHGQVSGRAADIWSMGVTLYCLLFGRIPFEKHGMIELYESIRTDELEFDTKIGDDIHHLLTMLLEKDPGKRINMEALREHPWVTRRGTDPLLSTAENVVVIVEAPTEEELNAAITGNMGHLVAVVRAVKRFKQLVFSKRSDPMEGILGSRIVQPPLAIRPSALRKAKSQDTHDRLPTESALIAEGVHRFIRPGGTAQLDGTVTGGQSRSAAAGVSSSKEPTPSPTAPQPGGSTQTKAVHENVSHRPTTSLPVPTSSAPITPTHGKGHAHDPLQDQLYLNIGTGEDCEEPAEQLIVSESPSNVDMDVYETAYQEEINRITARKETSTPGHLPTLYMTRRVENVKSLRDTHLIVDSGRTRDELKANIKALAKKAQKGLEGRAESERLAGKEGMYTKVWGNFSHLKGKVDEARDILREEDREKERQRSVGGAANTSRDSTPVPRGVSRSSTPVQGS